MRCSRLSVRGSPGADVTWTLLSESAGDLVRRGIQACQVKESEVEFSF